MFDHIAAALEEIDRALGRFDADGLVGAQPAAALEALARHERAVAAARLALTERAARMHQWERHGYRSFEDWLAATQGTSQGRARQRARTARKIKDRPKTAKALADGDISEDEADVVADAAAKDPDAEDDLIGTAKNKARTNKQLRDKAARVKAAAEDDQARARRLRDGRTARWGRDRDGFWAASTKQQPHVGAEMQSRLDAEVDRRFRAARKTGTHQPKDRYRADALAALILGREPAPGADRGEAADAANRDQPRWPERSPRRGQQSPAAPPKTQTQVPVAKEMVLVIDLAAYRGGHTVNGETCEIRGVGPVPVSVAHQWAHDAFIKAVITNGTDIRTVAHFGRHIPAHLRTALELRDPACVVPGCDNPRQEWDHHQPHAQHGETSLDNLRGPCTPHHRQITHHHYRLEGDPGHRRWIHPNGQTLAADNPADLPQHTRAP